MSDKPDQQEIYEHMIKAYRALTQDNSAFYRNLIIGAIKHDVKVLLNDEMQAKFNAEINKPRSKNNVRRQKPR